MVSQDQLVDPFPDLVLPNPTLEIPAVSTPLPVSDVSSASHDSMTAVIPSDPPLRRSTRVTHPPSYLNDF